VPPRSELWSRAKGQTLPPCREVAGGRWAVKTQGLLGATVALGQFFVPPFGRMDGVWTPLNVPRQHTYIHTYIHP
jgi:hypothetical protein